jgi:hypothetical protein
MPWHNSGLQKIQCYRWSTQFTVHCCTSTWVLSLHYSYPCNGSKTVSLSLQITHGVLFAQPNSYIANILQPPIPKTRLNSIPSLSVSYPGRPASGNSTNSSQLNSSFLPLCPHHTENTASLFCEGMFTAPLHRDGSYKILHCVFVAVGIYLPSCWLATIVYSDFTIVAFGRHVTKRCSELGWKVQQEQLHRNTLLSSCAMKQHKYQIGNEIMYFSFLRLPWVDICTRYPNPVFHIFSGMPAQNSTNILPVSTYSRGFHGCPFYWSSFIDILLEWNCETAIPQNMNVMRSNISGGTGWGNSNNNSNNKKNIKKGRN